MTTNKPTILLVLGMHRSGTSLVAQLVAKWGAYMGNDLIPASESNEDGHWEYKPLVSLNEKMLAFTGNYWYAPPLSVDVSTLMNYFEKEARQLVDEMDQNETIWCWKDPRMITFLPFWRKILSDRKLIFLVSFRDPLSVATSLQTRNNFPIFSAISFWEFKTRIMMEELSPNDNCFFLEYEKLVENPKETCKSLLSFLNHSSNLEQGIEKYEAMLNSVKPNLRHSKPISNIYLDPAQESLYKLLKSDNPIEKYNKDVSRIQFIYDILDVNKTENYYKEKNLEVQLFVSTNKNSYSEQNSITSIINLKSNQIVFDVSGYYNITNLRLDPLNEWTSLSFLKMELYSKDMLVGVVTEYESNARAIISGNLFFTTDDPQILFDLNDYENSVFDKVIFHIDYRLIGFLCKVFFAEHIDLFLADLTIDAGLNNLAENSFQAQYKHLLQIIEGLKESLSECNSELYSKEEILNDNRTEINKLSEELKSKELLMFNSYELINKLEVENSNECKKVEKLEEELNFINESIQAKDQEIEAIKKLNEQELKQTNSALKMLMDNERKKLIELHKKHLLGRLAGQLLQFCIHPFVYLRKRRDILEVLQSGLFDDAYYLEQNPDLYLTTVNLLQHYMQYGWKEGRNPNTLFDAKFYLENNPDVKEAGVNPLLHYIQHGKKEGRKIIKKEYEPKYKSYAPKDRIQLTFDKRAIQAINESGLFDAEYYCRQYEDIRLSNNDPLEHYIEFGWKEGRNPNLVIDTGAYIQINNLFGKIEGNPLEDLIQNGISKHRKIGYNQNYDIISEFGIENQYVTIKNIEKYIIGKSVLENKATNLISVVLPVYKSDLVYLRECIDSVLQQSYQYWELIIVDDGSNNQKLKETLLDYSNSDIRIKVIINESNRGISGATNCGIENSTGEFVAFLDHDDVLAANALSFFAEQIDSNPEFDVFYSDQDKMDKNGRLYEPFLKPDWSPWLFNSVMYVGHLLAFRKSFVSLCGNLDSKFDGVQDFEFLLRLTEHTQQIFHIPEILYHWRAIDGSIAQSHQAKNNIHNLQLKAVENHLKRLKINAIISKSERPHRLDILPVKKENYPLVSIIIPTKDAPELLEKCLNTLYNVSSYPNFEVILIDNNSTNKKALQIMKKYPCKIIKYNQHFNFSKVNNLGVKNSNGEYLIFLNNDIEIIHSDWIQNMLFYAEQPGVGAVGPLLLYDDYKVQHAGVVLGFNEVADHVYRNYDEKCDGYFGTLSSSHEVSAVTAACLMMRKKVFAEIGQFNELYEIIYQDVDLCLKIRSLGYKIVYVSNSRLIHHESKTRGSKFNFADKYLILDLWQDLIEKGDPYYNSNLSLAYHPLFPGYSILNFKKLIG